jgi:hypothetical protein
MITLFNSFSYKENQCRTNILDSSLQILIIYSQTSFGFVNETVMYCQIEKSLCHLICFS